MTWKPFRDDGKDSAPYFPTPCFCPAAPRGAQVNCKEACSGTERVIVLPGRLALQRVSPPRSPPLLCLPEGRDHLRPSLVAAAGMAAAATAAEGGSGPGTDTRLDQETARWLRWDKVRGDRVLGPPGRGAGYPA